MFSTPPGKGGKGSKFLGKKTSIVPAVEILQLWVAVGEIHWSNRSKQEDKEEGENN